MQEQQLRSHTEALRDQDAELEPILARTPFMLTRCSRDLRYRYVSRAYAEMIGRTPDQVAGRPILEIMGPEGFETIRPHVEAVLQGQQVEYEAAVPFPGVGARLLHVTFVPDRDAQGDVIGWVASILDITERKRTEEALRESEVHLARAQEIAHLGGWSWDLVADRLYWSDEIYRLYGLPPGESVPRHEDFLRFVHPEDRARVEQGVQEGLAQTGPYQLDFRIVRPGGEERYVHCEAHTLLDPEGHPMKAEGTLQDITERKRVEETLRESEEKFRLLAETSPAAILIYQDGTHVYLNPAVESITGYRRGELLGKEVSGIIHPDYRQKVEKVASQRAEGEGVAAHYELRILTKDGHERWLDISSVSILYGSRPAGMVVAFDITERKEAEEKLRESQTILQTIIESTPDYISLKDREGRYVMMNSAAAQRLSESTGVSAAEMIGKKDDEILPFETARPVMDADRQVVTSGKTLALDQSFTFRNKLQTFSTIKSPYCDITGNVAGVVNFSRDITERKQAEAALRELNMTLESKVTQRTAELQQRASQLQKLTLELTQAEERERRRIAVILHEDLQQQLAGAKFHLNLVKGRTRDDRLRADMEQVDTMLKDAIEQSRSLSRDLSPAVAHMNDLAEVLQWLANRVRAQQGLRVQVEVRGDMMLRSEALALFLFRAVQEMLFNIIKHTQVRQAAIRVRRIGRYVCLSVSDQGRGFDPQTLHETSGVGLFSIRERTELLGGRLQVKSTPGKGSRFRIMVPDGLKAEDNRQKTDDSQWKAEGGPDPSSVLRPPSSERALRVLLVDDHRIVRTGLAAMLRGTPGIELVGEAPDGREGINMAVDLRPDVVIMDVSMPLMKGDEATRQIKKYLPQTRVIALSMYDEADKKQSMFEAGAEGYLLKTVSAEELLVAIRGKELNGRR